MTLPHVTFGDPERLTITALGTAQTDYPATTLTGTSKVLQVALEGGPADYPVRDVAQVRVVAHRPPGKRTDVKADADAARSLLYRYAGSSQVAAIRPKTGRSAVVEDPDTKNLMCWFLVDVVLKPTTVA